MSTADRARKFDREHWQMGTFDKLAAFADQETADLKATIATLRAENERLRSQGMTNIEQLRAIGIEMLPAGNKDGQPCVAVVNTRAEKAEAEVAALRKEAEERERATRVGVLFGHEGYDYWDNYLEQLKNCGVLSEPHKKSRSHD